MAEGCARFVLEQRKDGEKMVQTPEKQRRIVDW